MTPEQHPTAPGAEDATPDAAIAAMPRGPLANIRRRLVLTYQYLGWREVLWRALTFPIRFTPLRHRLKLGTLVEAEQRRAASWYREKGRPVTIVIPAYGDPAHVAEAVKSIRRTTSRDMVTIVVADDATPSAEHVAALKALDGIDKLIIGERNAGFAANANRGLEATDPELDVVLLNADVIAQERWLECLQYAAYCDEGVGIVGAKLLYPDGRIQHAGVHRNLGAPVWFDHRLRFKPADYGPANVTEPVLAVTGACMYVRREVIDAVGLLDERYPMAYEDVDWCLRAWQAGFRVLYFPPATLVHLESVTRGTQVGEREHASQVAFWERWGEFFDGRGASVRTPDGHLRVVYVTEGTGVGGGHRDIFEHLDRLLERGHDVKLFTLGDAPDWYDLRAPVHTFEDYDDLTAALAAEDAIKVATWWNTGVPVWIASVLRGIPVFFVQDIETSYYPDHERNRHVVLAGYRQEFRFMTISSWNADRLRELGLESTLVPPGIDLDNFRPLADVQRRDDMLLALGRTNPLKNLPLTIDAWKALPGEPELCMFGIEPELGPQYGARYVKRPSDAEVNVLFNEATVFVQTSTHEGFCLPPLEAMATGGAVVCTDANGNRDFCVDGENCLIPEPTVPAVSAAIARLLADPQLRERLGDAGRATAKEYTWERRIDELEAFLQRISDPEATTPPIPPLPEPAAAASPPPAAPAPHASPGADEAQAPEPAATAGADSTRRPGGADEAPAPEPAAAAAPDADEPPAVANVAATTPRRMPALRRWPSDGVTMSLLAIVLAFLTWPLQTLEPGPYLDPAWKLALNMAATQGLNFGPDLTFSVGPLGFLRGETTMYAFPWTTRLSFTYSLAVQVALCLAVLWALRRNVRSLPVAALLAFFICSLIFQEPALVLVFVVAVGLVRGELPRRFIPAILFATGALVAVQLLAKLNTGIVVVALCAIALLACRDRRRLTIACLGGGMVVGLVAGWGLTGQSFAAIPDYVSGSLQVLSGYSEAMGYEEATRQWELWAALAVTLVGLVIIMRADEASSSRVKLATSAMWLVLAYTTFKAGFVRHDAGHANVFFATMLGGLAVLPLRHLTRPTAALTVLFVATALFASLPVAPTDLVEPIGHPETLVSQARTVADGSTLNARIVRARQRLAAFYPLDPRVFAAVAGHTVHVDPNETSVVWAYRLRWKPVPVFQSYVAFTAGLDERNAKAFASASGPERILRHNVVAVDGRNPDWESPAAVRSMFCHYREVVAASQWQVLARIPNRCGAPRLLGETRARYGKPVAVPASPGRRAMVYAQLDGVAVGGLERIRTALYRAVPRAIVLDGERSFRLVPGTAADGLVMRVPRAIDYPVPFDLDQATEHFVVTKGTGEQPDDDLRVRFYAVDVR